MKKLYRIIAIVFCCLFLFPVVIEAKTMELNKEYTAKVDCDGIDEVSYKLKIAEAGKYKVTISFDECYKSYYDDTPVFNSDVKMRFVVSSGKNEYKCEVSLGEEKAFIVGLDKGSVYIDSNEPIGEKYKISTIKVEKVPTKKYSFSQAYQFAKKNKSASSELKKTDNYIRISGWGISDESDHLRDGYSLAYVAKPYIDIVKQGNTTYAEYSLYNFFFCYSISYMDDSDLQEVVIYNKNDRMKFEFDSYNETNKYDYVDYFYKDECKGTIKLFKSYVHPVSDVNKLINIIKADDSKIQIRDSAQKNTYYTIKFDKTAKKQMLDSLRIYKELMKQYK